MTQSNAQLETELKSLIVDALQLENVSPESIVTEDPLFGEGLGLDSIDALELASAVEKAFGVKFTRSINTKAVFHSVQSLAAYIAEQRSAKDGAAKESAQ